MVTERNAPTATPQSERVPEPEPPEQTGADSVHAAFEFAPPPAPPTPPRALPFGLRAHPTKGRQQHGAILETQLFRLPAHPTNERQRHNAILEAQQVHGNAFVQRALEAPANGVSALTIQRAAIPPIGILEGRTITIYSDLAGVYKYMGDRLMTEESALRGGGASIPKSFFELRRQIGAYASAWANDSNVVAQVYYDIAYDIHEEWVEAMKTVEKIKTRLSARRMRAAAFNIERGVNAFRSRVIAKLQDAQNGAYHANDEDLLTEIAGYVAKANGYVKQAAEAQKTVFNAAVELANLAGEGVKCPPAVKYLYVFEALAHAKTAFDSFQAVVSVASTGATGYSEAVGGIKAFVTLAEGASSLLKATVGMSLATSPFFSEMLDVALKALEHLFKVTKAISLGLIKQGRYGDVDWNHFPGGEPTFHFMLATMRAGGPEGVPSPVPAQVSDYFVGREDEIEAGLEGGAEGNELPTEGFLWWEKVDPKKISAWVFSNRQNIWAMFYGSLDASSLD